MIRTQHEGPVTTIVMNRPPVNAMDPEFVARFNSALDEVDRLAPTLVVIRSEQRAFCAGADLALIRSYFDKEDGIEQMTGYVRSLHQLFDRIEALPAVTLACINGHALGGGLEMTLACDLRIASHAAKLGLPEARVGMIPGAGGTQRLPRLIGPGLAKRLILGAEVVDGAEALRLGIVQWAAEPEAFDATIARLADSVASLSKGALRASKECIAAYYNPSVNGFEREIAQPLQSMKDADTKARITQFFASRTRQ